MTYYVIGRFYDTGKVTSKIVSGKEYNGEKNESTQKYDQYVDEFNTYAEALEFHKDHANA